MLSPTAINPKVIVLMKSSDLIKKGEIIPAENQAAAMVFKNSDKTLSWGGVKFCLTLMMTLYYTPNFERLPTLVCRFWTCQ